MPRLMHPIPPVYNAESRVLVLGSFPSPKSREQGFFYGHPQNRFWKVLAAVFGSQIPQTVPERRTFLLENRVAVWDVLASCEITGAADSTIKNPVVNDFSPLFAVADIRAVFTTGATAHKLYERLTGNAAILLPSPSPANCAMSLEKLVEAYRKIVPFIRA